MTATLHVASDHDPTLPRLTKLVGEALTALHRWNEAEAPLQTIVQSNLTQSLEPLLWRCQISLGKLYQAMQLGDDAEREFVEARLLIQKLAKNVENEADRNTFLQNALAMTGVPPLPRAASSGLTSRETEVARLVAQGASNRTIAEALVISERTVESHVSSVLSKMHFSSRSQIVAWIIEQGLNHADS
jgi:DNA-binding CsgD family transcriptional regulator